MKTPSELTRAQLESIVGQIQSILWVDNRTGLFDPDRSWDCETIEWVSGVLQDAGLQPEVAMPAPGATPDLIGPEARPEGDVPAGNPSVAGAWPGLLAACEAVLRRDDSSADDTFQLPEELRRPIEEAIAHASRHDRTAGDAPADVVQAALHGFLETIEATGGCFHNEGGVLAPAGDPEWTDLADAYVRACTAIGRTPMIAQPEDES